MDKYLLTEEEVRGALVPQQTSSYKPISHGSIIDVTRDSIRKNGFRIVSESYRGSYRANVVTGFYDLQMRGDKELGVRIAWQNSYNKQVSFKYVIGTHVFICSNGMFFGNMGSFRKKHVGEIQTIAPNKVEEFIATADSFYQQSLDFKEQLKAISCEKDRQAELAGLLYFGRDIIPNSVLTDLKNEINQSSCDYNAPNTMWEFYNKVTYVLRYIHPVKYFKIHQDFHNAIIDSI